MQNAVDAIQGHQAETPPNTVAGVVEIDVSNEDEQIVVSVSDNGIGLPPSERDRLTEPYVTTRERGTGLGLAIVRKIMEDHGGTIRLEDRDNGGARVSLVFTTDANNTPDREERRDKIKTSKGIVTHGA